MYVSIDSQGHFFTIYFQVLYVLCFSRPRSSIGVGLEPMTSQNGGQDGRHGSKMATMTSRSRWV